MIEHLASLFQVAPVVCSYILACQIEQGDHTGAAATLASKTVLFAGSALYFRWKYLKYLEQNPITAPEFIADPVVGPVAAPGGWILNKSSRT